MVTAARQLLALGHFRREQRLALADAAEQAAFVPEFVEGDRDAARWLDTHAPHVVLLDESEGSRALCLEARAQSRHAQIPMLSLSRELDDLTFAEVFAWGGDDALAAGDTHGLVTRLRGLPVDAPGPPRNGRGIALIVDTDRARRIVRGRVLRNAGYSIEFAVTDEDALARVREHSPKVVVASADTGRAPAELLAAARSQGSQATWIVTCAPRDLAAFRTGVEPLGNAAVTDGFAPAENVVFLANELERGGANNQRASRRLLYGTRVSFRGAGRGLDEHGYSYNISEGGLYVRTLALPEDDIVWLEVSAPRSDRCVRLEGKVVWRRRFGPSPGATVPPGFGVALTDGARRDLEGWRAGYASFAAVLGFTS